jgi:hypothetical protein
MKIQRSLLSCVIQGRCLLILRSVGDGRMRVGHWGNDINSGNRCTRRNKTVPVALRLLQITHTDWPGTEPTPLQ